MKKVIVILSAVCLLCLGAVGFMWANLNRAEAAQSQLGTVGIGDVKVNALVFTYSCTDQACLVKSLQCRFDYEVYDIDGNSLANMSQTIIMDSGDKSSIESLITKYLNSIKSKPNDLLKKDKKGG